MEVTKKEIWSWAFYDFANSAYASLIPVLLFPLFYKTVILANSAKADLYWGIAVGVSVLLAGLISPFIGALADLTKKRKLVFILSSIVAVIGTGLLAITSRLDIISATIIFMLTNMAFTIALTLYDSLLYNVSNQNNSAKISGFGWAMGYVGGLLCMILIYSFLKKGVNSEFFWITFIIVAIFYLIFSIPAFFNIKEQELINLDKVKNPIKESFNSIFRTLKNWRQYKYLFLFLLGFYFLTEGITTLMFFFALFANTTLNLETSKIAILLITAQIIAIPATILIANITDKFGHKKILIYTLIGWCITTLILMLAKNIYMVYGFVVVGGLVIGSSQSTARSWYNKIIPSEKRAELFGFNAFASKISATFGPALFGFVSVFSGSQRIAVFSVLIYFLIALFIFIKVKE